MNPPPATRLLAEFAAGCDLHRIPEVVLQRAKLTVLDTIGVSLAATDVIADLAAALCRAGAGTCTAWGLAGGVDAIAAATCNGTLANTLDFDEGYHLATTCLPAALAMGEHTGASGPEVLRGYIVARECGARLTAVIDGRRREGIGPTSVGWWHVGIVGPVAAAIAAGSVLGLDVPTQQAAIGLATCASGGFRRNMGTMAKGLHSGLAAGHGVRAALLAQAGVTGEGTILEGPLGLVAATTAGHGPDWSALSRLGSPFELSEHLPLKKYPTCTPIHRLLDAVLALQREHGVRWDDIAGVFGDHHRFSLWRDDPADGLEAAFSPAYLLAAALVAGELGLAQLEPAWIHDPRVAQLTGRMHDTPGAASARMVLHDGTVLERALGATPRLTEMPAIVEKFRRCAATTLAADQQDRVIAAVLGLEAQPSLEALMAALGAPGGRA